MFAVGVFAVGVFAVGVLVVASTDKGLAWSRIQLLLPAAALFRAAGAVGTCVPKSAGRMCPLEKVSLPRVARLPNLSFQKGFPS